MTFGEKLLSLRRKSGFSQEELAEKLGVSRQAVSRWESGTAMPDSPNLLQISNLFGVSADYLLHDEYESDFDIPVAKETKKEERRNSFFLVAAIILFIFSAVNLFIALDELNVMFLISGVLYLFAGIIFVAAYFKKENDPPEKAAEKKRISNFCYLIAAILFWCASFLNFVTAITGGIEYAAFSGVGILNMVAGAVFFLTYLKNRKSE
ncbi:MAG: helix-turn-helix transcriptional regulator [Oscillospiraceae bacterium]|nr:helix-turn-helix transcriptional regulator [Oscillospiraceae bacterium]